MAKKRIMKIGNRIIGTKQKPFIIAEIGVNHNGDYKIAESMVYSAYLAGAECVKFQYHIPDKEMTDDAKKTIPGNSDRSIYDIIKDTTLTFKELKSLKEYVESLGMIFLCSPFSKEAVDKLEEMDVVAYKIGSGECNNTPLVEHIASMGKPVILSTGMNDLSSIHHTVKILKEYGIDYAILHCTSLYPTPYKDVRLKFIKRLQKEFPVIPIGLSDHSIGNYTAYGAISLGATIIEKHYTHTKKYIEGPDIEISIDEDGLRELIKGCNAIHDAMKGHREVDKKEQVTINFAYASVVSTSYIKKGDKLDTFNTWVKRPGTGDILAKDYLKMIGKVAKRDIPPNVQIRREWIE